MQITVIDHILFLAAATLLFCDSNVILGKIERFITQICSVLKYRGLRKTLLTFNVLLAKGVQKVHTY